MSAAVQTSASRVLQELFECERHVTLFHGEMPIKACLRRQVERQRGAKPGTLGPPTKPYCASGECALGHTMAEKAKLAGVIAKACPGCGTALLGDVACETCAASAMEARGAGPAKGFLPPTGAPPSERIWNGEAPDVPIGRPPGSPTPGEERAAAVVARVREAAPRVAPATQDQRPAEPAREATMSGKTCSKCGKGLRADNEKGICGDASACKARAGGAGKGAKPALPPRPRAVERSTGTLVRIAAAAPFDTRDATTERLVETIAACSAELAERAGRAERLKSQLEQIAAAVGSAAA